MVKPLSAITTSPSSKGNERKPLFLTSSLSEMHPVAKDETNVTMPSGEIPTRPLKVLVDLYGENVSDCSTNGLGTSHLSSVASVITLVLGYFCLKPLGMFLSITALDGQHGSPDSRRYMKFIQVVNNLLTLLW